MELSFQELQQAVDVRSVCTTEDGGLVAAWQYFPGRTNFIRYANGKADIHRLPTPTDKTVSFPDKIDQLPDGTFEIATSHMDKVSWIVSIKDNEVKAKIKGTSKTIDCPPTPLTITNLVSYAQGNIDEDEAADIDI